LGRMAIRFFSSPDVDFSLYFSFFIIIISEPND